MNEIPNIELFKLIKRLELIKSLITIEDEAEILFHVSKLDESNLSKDVQHITKVLNAKSYSEAVTCIDAFINRNQGLVIYINPQVKVLQLEAKTLESELSNIVNEKADLEKLLHVFSVRHKNEIGDLVLKILHYRNESAKGTSQEKEAEEDYKTFQNQFEATKYKEVKLLTNDEKEELKNKYRKASKLCHPDVVDEAKIKLATNIFSDLTIAYENNDLEKVREILEYLEKGVFFEAGLDATTEMQALRNQIKKLQLRISELKNEVEFIKNSAPYITIINIVDWDEYFNKAKIEFQRQIKQFENGK